MLFYENCSPKKLTVFNIIQSWLYTEPSYLLPKTGQENKFMSQIYFTSVRKRKPSWESVIDFNILVSCLLATT